MLLIKNLKAKVEDKEILNGINLHVNAGEIHAIMGPNGSGKSTLASVLAGREDYEVTEGEVQFLGKNLLELDPDVRACEGIFMAFQYPVEIPGVSTVNFMKTALNKIREHRGQPALDAVAFLQLMKEKMKRSEERRVGKECRSRCDWSSDVCSSDLSSLEKIFWNSIPMFAPAKEFLWPFNIP